MNNFNVIQGHSAFVGCDKMNFRSRSIRIELLKAAEKTAFICLQMHDRISPRRRSWSIISSLPGPPLNLTNGIFVMK